MVKENKKNEIKSEELKEEKVQDAKKNKNKKNDKVKKENKSSKKTKEKKIKKKPITTFKSEFKKIHWPSKKEMIKYSIATVIFTIFMALFCYAIGTLLMSWLSELR